MLFKRAYILALSILYNIYIFISPTTEEPLGIVALHFPRGLTQSVSAATAALDQRLRVEDIQNLNRCRSYWSTRAEDSRSTILVELVVVLSWDNTTHNNYDILTTELLKLCNNLRYKGKVTCCE